MHRTISTLLLAVPVTIGSPAETAAHVPHCDIAACEESCHEWERGYDHHRCMLACLWELSRRSPPERVRRAPEPQEQTQPIEIFVRFPPEAMSALGGGALGFLTWSLRARKRRGDRRRAEELRRQADRLRREADDHGRSRTASESETYITKYEWMPSQLYGAPEQAERLTGEIMNLALRECFVKVDNQRPIRTHTADLAPSFRLREAPHSVRVSEIAGALAVPAASRRR